MKRTFCFLVLLTLLLPAGIPAAQSTVPSHSALITWGPSPDAAANPTITYNVYRAPGTCVPTIVFTKLTATSIALLTYTDTTVTVGQWYCYASTAVLGSAESDPHLNMGGTATPIPVAGPTTIVIVSH